MSGGDGVNQVHIEPPVLTSIEKRERAQSLEAYLKGEEYCPSGWFQWTYDNYKWTAHIARRCFKPSATTGKPNPVRRGIKADWEATRRNWCRRETTTFQKPLAKGEVRVRETTSQEAAQGKAAAEFMKLSKLPENLQKSEAEIWKLVTLSLDASHPCPGQTQSDCRQDQ